ncbi:MAG: DUF3619 family protein [Azonexus sp.]|jgi:hypothetical protein|uniref:DUF3619 family protein n=1 Tax=Azonexus sp. TaxID=1872668 RepID=UPI0028226B15|nr:DUF3619 family protein [Azonexus sp.]MDR0775561.1 DUF3619 family protein [Azonexus sp.]
MNEQRYASRIRQVLNHGLDDIPPPAARRLEAARHLALSRQKQEAPHLMLAGAGKRLPWPMLLRSGTDFARVKPLLAIVALLAGMWLSFYWHSIQYVNEIGAVDSALLADDLPPEAFLDREFIEWLKDDSSPR